MYDELDPAMKEELDRWVRLSQTVHLFLTHQTFFDLNLLCREVEDFARRLNSDWPERMREILSLSQDRSSIPSSLNGNGSFGRCAGIFTFLGVLLIYSTQNHVSLFLCMVQATGCNLKDKAWCETDLIYIEWLGGLIKGKERKGKFCLLFSFLSVINIILLPIINNITFFVLFFH